MTIKKLKCVNCGKERSKYKRRYCSDECKYEYLQKDKDPLAVEKGKKGWAKYIRKLTK